MRKLCRVERKETPSFPHGAFSVKRSGASWVVDSEPGETSKLDALRAQMEGRRAKPSKKEAAEAQGAGAGEPAAA